MIRNHLVTVWNKIFYDKLDVGGRSAFGEFFNFLSIFFHFVNPVCTEQARLNDNQSLDH